MNFDTLSLLFGLNLAWQTTVLSVIVLFSLIILPREQAQTRYNLSIVAFFGVLFSHRAFSARRSVHPLIGCDTSGHN